MTLHPVAFVGHGAPNTILDPGKSAPWRAWGGAMPRPEAALVVSAHWDVAPPTIGSTRSRPLVYDFSGFPRALYEVRYDAPGAPALADRVESLLGAERVRSNAERGLDHGVWAPLTCLLPTADVPVLQLSLPLADGARAVFDLGRALAPLRREGVLLLGSGNVTHNFGALGPDAFPPDDFAVAFDTWTRDVLVSGDFDALLAYADRAPDLVLNHPTEEHWLPLLFAAGAASVDGGAVAFPVEGFEYQNLSRRCVQFG